MSKPELERQLAALRQGYAERLPSRAAALAMQAAGLARRWDPQQALDLQRELHNLAGSGASYGFPEVSRTARAAEEACGAALNGGAAPPLDDLLAALESLSAAAGAVRG
jgi:HPt (histidine-containing phosphotransfer) domain-containing protein